MSFTIIWSEQARSDLQHIYDFIAEDSVYYAEIVTGRTVPELENKDFREIIQGNYRIIYKITNKTQVSILYSPSRGEIA